MRQFKAVTLSVCTCHVQFYIAEMGVEWFWEILELIRAADVGPAEQQGKRTQFTDILESTPDFTLKGSFKDWRNIEALACS